MKVSPSLLATPVVRRAFETLADLSSVVVELTEHVEFADSAQLLASLRELRMRGARLALDDVGTGRAGLRQVTELRPDIVKLDRSLVQDADQDEVKLALVEMMLRLCSQLLVEGVETREELNALARLGVPLAQGFIFGKPALVPPPDDEDVAVRLKFLAGLQLHIGTVASLVEVTVATCPAGTDPSRGEPGRDVADLVVALDETSRPVAVHLRDRDRWLVAPAMTVLATESVSQALLRAMTRPAATRFVPVVCVDRAGRSAGVILVESLARAAARREEAVDIVLPG